MTNRQFSVAFFLPRNTLGKYRCKHWSKNSYDMLTQNPKRVRGILKPSRRIATSRRAIASVTFPNLCFNSASRPSIRERVQMSVVRLLALSSAIEASAYFPRSIKTTVEPLLNEELGEVFFPETVHLACLFLSYGINCSGIGRDDGNAKITWVICGYFVK